MFAKRTIVILVMSLLLATMPLRAFDAAQGGTVQIIKDAIWAAGDIKVGSLREFVEHNFELDGGAQTRETSRYMFKKCHFIKIIVRFARGDTPTSEQESPKDLVKSVSRPYLEYPGSD